MVYAGNTVLFAKISLNEYESKGALMLNLKQNEHYPTFLINGHPWLQQSISWPVASMNDTVTCKLEWGAHNGKFGSLIQASATSYRFTRNFAYTISNILIILKSAWKLFIHYSTVPNHNSGKLQSASTAFDSLAQNLLSSNTSFHHYTLTTITLREAWFREILA